MMRPCAIAALWFWSARVAGHGNLDHPAGSVWAEWNFSPSVTLPILIGILFYAAGVWRLWRRAGVGRGISVTRASAYAGGIAVLVLALMSPLDVIAGSLFSVHMVQHLLLILVAPPLLVVGSPDVALLWALPLRSRQGWAIFERGAARVLTQGKGPLIIVLLATGALWTWHLPQLYDLAVRNEVVHWAEHATFFVTAMLFWITVLRLRARDHADNGMRILYVFGMAIQGSLLGALITFASRPLYESHSLAAVEWGLTALEDQQIAGLIMWVPPALLYIGVVAYLFANWLASIEARNPSGEGRKAVPAAPNDKPLKW